ncbi:hypothetical protein KY358_02720, partial [Candidatus Woesearchaeota archaeon]|nr:hypothetical protein [Candidatus Woesearchaeota archaeon]
LALGIIFYAALRKNWKRFNLMDYRFKLTYLAYIFLFIAAFDVFLTLIITKRLEFPHFGILSLIALFAVPGMVRN